MQKWIELKSWLCNDVGRNEDGESCDKIRVSAVIAKMLDIERKEKRILDSFLRDEQFDGEF